MSTKQTIKDLNEEGQFFSQFAGITENDLESFKCGGKSKKVQKEAQGGKPKKAQTDMDNDDAINPEWLNQSVKAEQNMRENNINKQPQPYSEWKKSQVRPTGYKVAQPTNALPTAARAEERYKGGTYMDPTSNINGYRESVTANDGKWYQTPSEISLQYTTPWFGDSTFRETPVHTPGVRTIERTVDQRYSSPEEFAIMKNRWEAAKKASTNESWHNKSVK